MIISSQTKISEIIKKDKRAIDAIASVNDHFIKLKNPFLRKLLAPRVTVAMAAKVGNCDIETLFQKLSELGFTVKRNNTTEKMEKEIEFTPTKDIVELDVRPVIATGTDPLKLILSKVKELKDDQTLLIINSFEPIPLRHLLKKQNFISKSEKVDIDLFYTWFKKDDSGIAPTETPATDASTQAEFQQFLTRFCGKISEVDVREMEMPQPMITIISLLSSLGNEEALLVHHRKLPLLLFPELKEQGYNYIYNQLKEDYIQILIFKG
jgi:hypothetical protein